MTEVTLSVNGKTVTRDVPDGATVVGVPAKIVNKRVTAPDELSWAG